MQAVCSGFLYALETGANFIRSGNYKKVVVVGAEKMSSIINYADRATCPIFGDGGAAVMLEPTTEDFGIMDAVLRTDGKGLPFLHIKAGGSICTPSYYTLDNQMHYIYQEGRTVFKYAVSNMADACESIIARRSAYKQKAVRFFCALHWKMSILYPTNPHKKYTNQRGSFYPFRQLTDHAGYGKLTIEEGIHQKAPNTQKTNSAVVHSYK